MLQHYKTQGGVELECYQTSLEYEQGIENLLEHLDSQRGALFASSFEYPGRYTCWDIGFYNPPLAFICRQNLVQIDALNDRGKILLTFIIPLFKNETNLQILSQSQAGLQIKIKPSEEVFSEEERSRQPSVFTVIRLILAFFKVEDEPYLGLYGAFGFDLIFQFENLQKHKQREVLQRDMVLYLPDEIYVVNHRKEEAFIRRYDFQFQGQSTKSLEREGVSVAYKSPNKPEGACDHNPGEYAQVVTQAKERFACGDLFEVVPSQTFYVHYQDQPSSLFKKMRRLNPSPYGFFINLGDEEYLVGASPEMYVRVQGKRVETCPISGTIKRGADAIEDAENIQILLDSKKEESELTMCTDVDRNDKSRICEAGSVRVIGRRQIEMYSRVIHTVDHVEGTLRENFDAVDAFLTHMWVVTVTGAPKIWALNFIEEHEKSPRKWYAGAVGWFGFNGNLNTGLVLRTVRIEKGIAEIRVGATLLYDSIPESEEQETRLKASAFLDMLQKKDADGVKKTKHFPLTGKGKHVLLIDHQDSFVHTLANYFRQTGAEVSTIRFDKAMRYLEMQKFDLVVLSPGPGKPSDFNLSQTIAAVISLGIPLFGVCLGLQGIVEYFGGVLDVLNYPMHGKPSTIKVEGKPELFSDLGESFKAGRYHSLYARLNALPKELKVTAMSDDGVVMAVSHQQLPIHAVQFHPETILSLVNQAGLKIITNLMRMI
ncbi:anthranilate synthase component I [Fluoribacter dumoffii]|uniref:Anthranilate synthase n=1 Tax=Fluoribacter dumoffii TaxID=463 RepID=A0A377G8T3_9GAMM|nr:anthranilate synthase component I [Fluoribacter dumoffii]KTC90108.1 anthranilate synthase [Fluoribacter dumoffii NY 23]MCW8385405.1 anthranilate synthase component I [Fluoribacter dumoffii]MCW8418458.1 anthranilate synthase component I [Fluoribacter dumoffii]MCW8453700.1 anthranilate synthase component I [Fluoribacter dumoffii]MCW8462229.1 anthranilate synthase component I [Fluoribacter dumoffii]